MYIIYRSHVRIVHKCLYNNSKSGQLLESRLYIELLSNI